MKIGEQTLVFEKKPKILNTASIVGPKESEGPLSIFFDHKIEDELFGEESFEKAESKFTQAAIDALLTKAPLDKYMVDCIFAGDLLNQCIATGYAIRDSNIPLFGLYGACSTFVEALILASSFVNAGYYKRCIATASSHFGSAERQFRLPLQQGSQRTPTQQWTVTGAGAALVTHNNDRYKSPVVTHATVGKIVDMGIKDVANMGAAMAPAAFDTILTHLEDTKRKADYYDLIITGDLGKMGSEILIELLQAKGINISTNHNDCGMLIYDLVSQDMHAGGSGCACCATVFSGYVYDLLKSKKIKNVLLVATGALMSPVSLGQGESIPSIAHAVAIETEV
ncbi:MAG: stage V sporulation protein AD [Clostridia bacterium]|nr:stage V sporulation protein AD [Clostridia bacterium]